MMKITNKLIGIQNLKKVFFIIPSLGGGGAERVFVNLIKAIDKTAFDVTLVYLSDDRNVYEIPSDIRVINLRANRLRNSPIKILKLIWSERPNLVVSTQGHMNSMIMILKRFLPKKTKVIIRQTNIMSFDRPKNKTQKIVRSMMKKRYNKADKIICQSKYMMKDFILNTNISEDKVIIIHNPVDINLVQIKSKDKVKYNFISQQKKVFFTGRLDEVKRVPIIIEAFIKFNKKNTNSKLFIMGEGPKRKEIEHCIQENGLSNSIELLGFQKNPYKWLKHADLFVLASKHEGMPNALIESLALDIPVLVLKHPGGSIDILKNLGIEDRFVDKLEIDDESFARYDKSLSPKLKTHFGVENIVKEYERVFLSVLNKE